jgi:ABC-type phosphonate transport system ATPase subunit
MLKSIEFENYRGFNHYRLANLARVNLLVGKNNCGKTSVLDAIHLLASGGDPSVLYRMAYQRGEMLSVEEDEERSKSRRTYFADVSHFFNGHDLREGSFFRIATANDLGAITVNVVANEPSEQRRLFSDLDDIASPFALQFKNSRRHTPAEPTVVPVAENGAFSADLVRRFSTARGIDRGVIPVQFITPDSLEPLPMSQMWDGVLLERKEELVNAAMRILEPQLANIQFLTSPSPYRYGRRGGVVVAMEGEKRRVPLGTYGDGMRRLLALSLSLVRTNDGLLLVDEIDTGFHYSIMGDMWKLVVSAAIRSNVQVFASTHSLDCVRGLAWLCENEPDLRQEVSLQKIDRNLDEAVALDAEKIVIAARQDIEVR